MSQGPDKPLEAWGGGSAYENYMGRWSRSVAREFLNWLGIPAGKDWLDVGCGTGGLSQTILSQTAPALVRGVDRSAAFVAYAHQQVKDERLSFVSGDAQALPFAPASFDAVVSALMLNFVPDPAKALAEMYRVVRPSGTVALYVWDYAGEMQMLRYFWDAAAILNPSSQPLDEGPRFPICDPAALQKLFSDTGLQSVEVRGISAPTVFRDFDDYWQPFLGGQGPAPAYVTKLNEEQRVALREHLRTQLPTAPDGTISLHARAWAVKGQKS